MLEPCWESAIRQLMCRDESTFSVQKQGPPLPAEIPRWPIKEGAEGTAVTLRFTKEDETWDWLPEAAVSFSPPDTSGQVRSFPHCLEPHAITSHT